jgi:hypothetical protein
MGATSPIPSRVFGDQQLVEMGERWHALTTVAHCKMPRKLLVVIAGAACEIRSPVVTQDGRPAQM